MLEAMDDVRDVVRGCSTEAVVDCEGSSVSTEDVDCIRECSDGLTLVSVGMAAVMVT